MLEYCAIAGRVMEPRSQPDSSPFAWRRRSGHESLVNHCLLFAVGLVRKASRASCENGAEPPNPVLLKNLARPMEIYRRAAGNPASDCRLIAIYEYTPSMCIEIQGETGHWAIVIPTRFGSWPLNALR